MSQLTLMRHHIKAVQTIRKITQAMRLISMSTHSRIKQFETPLHTYQKTILQLFVRARSSAIVDAIASEESVNGQSHLLILIGSQKGLCGSFNSSLFALFEKALTQESSCTIITVGKRATNYVQKNENIPLLAFYNTFGLHNALTIAQNLMQEIIHSQQTYKKVSIVYNSAPSFFTQKPIIQQLIPTTLHQQEVSNTHVSYDWEQPPHEIIAFLTQQYLLSQLQHALLQSLLAEHAARFISMDSSTRNANMMLEELQLSYNKLRQAKITRELTELSSFFLT